MEKDDLLWLEKMIEKERVDRYLIQKDNELYYEVDSDSPFSGVQKVFFRKWFWNREKKIKTLRYFEGGEFVRYISYYRNGQVAVDHTLGRAYQKFFRDGTPDNREDVNHR